MVVVGSVQMHDHDYGRVVVYFWVDNDLLGKLYIDLFPSFSTVLCFKYLGLFVVS